MQLQLGEVVSHILGSAADKDSFRQAIRELAEIPPEQRLVVMLQVVSKDPQLNLVRLELARLLWQLECRSFALEQLVTLQNNVKSASLDQLISRLGGLSRGSDSSEESKTLASLDFDIEVVDPDK